MAEYLLRNSLNPGKVVACSVTFRQLVNKGEEGEPVWLIEVGTREPHKDGTGEIAPEYVHYTEDQNIDIAIKEATERIAKQIDWTPLTKDLRPPFVINYEPYTTTEVDINSYVLVDVKDIDPAAGIDPDSFHVTVNGIDVSDELELAGTPHEYRIIWRPPMRVYDYE